MIKNIAFTFTKFQYFTWLPVVYYSIEMTQTERLYHIVNTDSNWQNLIFTKHNNSTQISTYYPIMGILYTFQNFVLTYENRVLGHIVHIILKLLIFLYSWNLTKFCKWLYYPDLKIFALRTINHCLTSKLTTKDLG